jgi:copper chaperone CopZ
VRQLILLKAALVLIVVGAGPARADKVEVKGPHICCAQCVRIAEGLLNKVEGVSEAKADIKTKTVSFTVTDEKAAKAGIQALVDGGFFGVATRDGKEVKIAVPRPGGKSLTVVVTRVHVCCIACEKAITQLFQYSKVSFEGEGPQRTVRIEGPGCVGHDETLITLRRAGFNGTLAKETTEQK